AVISAHLRKGRGALRPASAGTRSQIAGEPVVGVGSEHAGIDIDVAITPEARAVAPDGVVVDVIIGERPEQRPDPAISAIPVPPPSMGAVPADQRGAGRELSARDWVGDDAGISQRMAVRE